jgi:VWFA-related protein
VDTSPSQRNVLSDERNASYRFFDQILREDRDLAFVIHFDYEVELLQDLTASRQLLEKGLDELQVAQPTLQRQGQGSGNSTGGYPTGGYPGGGSPGGYPGGGGQGGQGRARGGTDLYDAVLLAGDELMRKQKGRKALILLSDGVDTGSKTSLFDAIAAAQKSDSLVYSILFADPNAYGNTYAPMGGRGMGRRGGMGRMPMPMPGGGGELEYGKKVLQQMAGETGGRFFQVSRTHPLDKIYAAIEEDLRNQYNIGYTPDPLGQAGSYRHIHLTAKKKNQVVQTREGYYLNPA